MTEVKHEAKRDGEYRALPRGTRLIDIVKNDISALGIIGCRAVQSMHVSMAELKSVMGTLNWHKKWLSRRPDLDFRLVLEYPGYGWDWYSLSKSVPLDFLLAHGDLPWDSNGLSRNGNIPLSFTLEHHSKYEWDWYIALTWMVLSVESVRVLIPSHGSHIGMRCLSSNDSLTIDILKTFPDLGWDMGYATMSKSISMADIKSNPDIKWDRNAIPCRHDFRIDMLDKCEVDASTWMSISQTAHPLDIIKNPHLPWHKPSLCQNLRLNMGVVEVMGLSDKRHWLMQNVGLRLKMQDPIVRSDPDAYMRRATTSPVDIWNYMIKRDDFTMEKFLEKLSGWNTVEIDDIRLVFGRRIVRYMKPYTWVTRRNRVNRLVDVGFPHGIARLIVSLM